MQKQEDFEENVWSGTLIYLGLRQEWALHRDSWLWMAFILGKHPTLA